MTRILIFRGACALRPARPLVRSRRGFALEATLLVLILTSVLIGVALTWVTTVTRTAGIDVRGSAVSYAAEAGADAVMSQVDVAMEDGVLSAAEMESITLPTLPGFTFAPPEVIPAGAPIVRTRTSGTFAGLYELSQPVSILVQATDPGGNRSKVNVTVDAASIPLFQFGVFYQDDLEIHPGANMTFEGWVHTNGNLYLSANNLAFKSRITTPQSLFHQRKAYNEKLDGVMIDNAAGVALKLNFDSRSAPTPDDFKTKSAARYNSRVMTSAHGVTDLALPLPPGMAPIELVNPKAPGDDEQVKKVKFAWKADWHIVVNLARLDDSDLCAAGGVTFANRGIRPVPTGSGSVKCAHIFDGKSNAFYDGREERSVDVLDIDVGQLRQWVLGTAAGKTEIMYVTFTGFDASNNKRDYPAVRLRNGSRLPNELTIATDRPLYVQGDYNTTAWVPASLLGDAITFLSPGWDDTKQGSLTVRAASSMSVYAAVAAGHSATPCDWQESCSPSAPPPLTPAHKNYGGGLENFPRFLENWGGRTMTYRGSLVSLFESQYAARRRWNHQHYYDAPGRDWKFDLRFNDPNKLPPGTPVVGSALRTAFRPVF